MDTPLQKMARYPEALEHRIMEIAKSNGGVFSVSPRYRDFPLSRACKRMKKKGLFKQIRYGIVEVYKII